MSAPFAPLSALRSLFAPRQKRSLEAAGGGRRWAGKTVSADSHSYM